MTASEEKRALRPCLKEIRSKAFSEKKSRAVCENILSLPFFKKAKTVLFYAAIQDEASLESAFEKALGMGISAAFPRSEKNGAMTFHKIESLSALKEGRFGVPEPDENAPLIEKGSLSSTDICLVPALAYDTCGYRLGYGGGYYDRYLADFKGIKIGIAFDASIVSSLPREKNDIKVDYIITESRVEKA